MPLGQSPHFCRILHLKYDKNELCSTPYIHICIQRLMGKKVIKTFCCNNKLEDDHSKYVWSIFDMTKVRVLHLTQQPGSYWTDPQHCHSLESLTCTDVTACDLMPNLLTTRPRRISSVNLKLRSQ